MTTITFDTLEFSKRAQEAGFTEKQAEFQAREAAQAIELKLATKVEVNSVRDELLKEMKMMEQRLTIKMGGMITIAVGILLAFKFFHIT